MLCRLASVSHERRRAGKRRDDDGTNLFGGGVEGADVVRRSRQAIGRSGCELQQRFDTVGHRHERDSRVGTHEARIRVALRGGVHHLRRIVRRAARRHGLSRNQPGKSHRAEIDSPARAFRCELLVVPRVVASELLAIQLVAAVHRRRKRPLVLADTARTGFGREIRQPVGGNRRRVHEDDRAPMRFGLALRELEEVERAFDVDLCAVTGVNSARVERRAAR